MERGSATPGERASAEWVGRRLAKAGASGVRLHGFRYPRSYASSQSAHLVAGLLAAARGGAAGAALAVAALVSLDWDYSGRRQWLRRFLPAGAGTNVVARVPPRAERRRTLVLVAHHDAARTGLVWHPAAMRASASRARSRGGAHSYGAPGGIALSLVAAGGLLGTSGRGARLGAAARTLGAAVLAGALALLEDVRRGGTVPGASDNATGVAVLLALVEAVARQPFEDTELVALVPGCEEAGMGGMLAWLAGEGRRLDPSSTLVLGLDTLGAGEPTAVSAEAGPLRLRRYRARDLEWADRGAERAGLPRPPRFGLGAWTDPIVAVFAGLPAVSLVSLRDGGFTNYHLPTDTPERVDWTSVERSAGLGLGIAEAFAGR